MVNTIHFQASDGGLVSGDWDTFTSAFTNFYNATGVRALFSNEVKLKEIRYYDMPATVGPLGQPAHVSDISLVGGGSSASTLPPQCAITVTWKTTNRRRWGRIYLGGLVTSALSDGRIGASVVSLLGAAIDTFGTTLVNGGNELVVWHRAAWEPTFVDSFTVDDVWDVQRRRRYAHALNRASGVFGA